MKIIVQNLAVEYQDEGAGNVILFLHGWQDNLHTFDALVPLLSLTARIIRLDLPGFGRSEMPQEAWGLDGYVRFVHDFMQKINVPVDTLVGHSFGGRIALKGTAAKELPARRLILIGSAGIAKRRTFRNTIVKVLAKIGGMVFLIPPFTLWRDSVRKKIYTSLGSDYERAGPLKKIFLNVISEDVSASAKEITTQTLLIWGADDTETLLSDGMRLSRLIPNSQLKIIPSAGHFVHQEKPQQVAQLIQAFL